MNTKFKQLQHGEKLTIDLHNRQQNECLHSIDDLASETTEFLLNLMIAIVKYDKFELPCRKCLLDTALKFRDIGSLLEELANGK